MQYVQNLQKQNIKLRPTVNRTADHFINKNKKLNTNKSNLHYVQTEAVLLYKSTSDCSLRHLPHPLDLVLTLPYKDA